MKFAIRLKQFKALGFIYMMVDWERNCIMLVGRSTMVTCATQGVTHPSFIVMNDEDMGCIWARVG